MRDDAFTTNCGIVNLGPTRGTHWVMFVDEFCFDSNGYPVNVVNQINFNRGMYSEYQTDEYRKMIVIALHVFYLTQTLGLEIAVLNLNYQFFSIIKEKLYSADFKITYKRQITTIQSKSNTNEKVLKIIK